MARWNRRLISPSPASEQTRAASGANEDYGLCYGAMLLYSGNFQAAVETGQFENARLVMGVNPYHFTSSSTPSAAASRAMASSFSGSKSK